MKLQQTKQGQHFLSIPKAVVTMLGWRKHDDIGLRFGSTRGSIELKKEE